MKVAICFCNWLHCLAFGREVRLVGSVGASISHTDSHARVNEIVQTASEWVRRALTAELWATLMLRVGVGSAPQLRNRACLTPWGHYSSDYGRVGLLQTDPRENLHRPAFPVSLSNCHQGVALLNVGNRRPGIAAGAVHREMIQRRSLWWILVPPFYFFSRAFCCLLYIRASVIRSVKNCNVNISCKERLIPASWNNVRRLLGLILH